MPTIRAKTAASVKNLLAPSSATVPLVPQDSIAVVEVGHTSITFYVNFFVIEFYCNLLYLLFFIPRALIQ